MQKFENDTKVVLERISLDEFTQIADETKVEESSREMAQMVLVNGMPGVKVAEILEVPKQRVGIAVEGIRKRHRAFHPDFGLCKTSVPVPAQIIDALDVFGDAYLKMDAQARVDAISKIRNLFSELSKHQIN